MPTQSPVAFAISSPTFFGDKPRGPIFGARAEDAPTSPPVALKVLQEDLFSNYGDRGEFVTLERTLWLTFLLPRWDQTWELRQQTLLANRYA